MSFQAYPDNIEEVTGKTPREFTAMAEKRGFDQALSKSWCILGWLKQNYGLAVAMAW
jgi:hypothetical protein